MLRVLGREGEAARDVIGGLEGAGNGLPGAMQAAQFVAATLDDHGGEARARSAVERLALLAAGSALAEGAPRSIAEAFARSRLQQPRGSTYGTADLDRAEVTELLDRALPAG